MNELCKEQPLDSKTKWSYCIGATGRDMAYTLVNMYLLTYIQYTMKLTAAQFAVISLSMFLCLVWDAINDLMMGIIIENSHLPHGKFRPWIFIGSIVNAIIIVLLFTVRPSGWLFVAFFAIGYLCWGMSYTMNDIAYWGMLPSLSSDPATRNSLVTFMSIFICIGQFSVAGILPLVIAGNAIAAYRIAAVIIALCFIAFQQLTFWGVTERPRKDATDKLKISDIYRIFRRNDQLVTAGASSLLFNIGNGLLIVFAMNFFYFEFGYKSAGGYILLFTIMYGLGTLVSQSVFAFLSKRFTRFQLLRYCTLIIICCYIAFASFGYLLPKNIILLNSIGFLIFFHQGLMNLIIIVMINNTIEYDEFRFHERHDSVISAVRSFSVKLAGGLNQGIAACVLIISGIFSISQKITELEISAGTGKLSANQVLTKASTYTANVEPVQTFVLRMGMVSIPILAIGCSYFLLKKKYKITEDEYQRMVKNIHLS